MIIEFAATTVWILLMFLIGGVICGIKPSIKETYLYFVSLHLGIGFVLIVLAVLLYKLFGG